MNFFTRCCIAISLMVLTSLGGIQFANAGLKRMKGYHDPTFEQVAHMTGTADGRAAEAVLRKEMAIEEKQKRLEELRSFNAAAGAGRMLAVGVQKAVRLSTDALSGKIAELFHALDRRHAD